MTTGLDTHCDKSHKCGEKNRQQVSVWHINKNKLNKNTVKKNNAVKNNAVKKPRLLLFMIMINTQAEEEILRLTDYDNGFISSICYWQTWKYEFARPEPPPPSSVNNRFQIWYDFFVFLKNESPRFVQFWPLQTLEQIVINIRILYWFIVILFY